MTDDTPTASPRPARLRRRRDDRVLGGVCAAIARSLGVDPLLVRIVAIVFAFISAGTAVLAYLLAWMLIPRDNADFRHSAEQASTTPGAATPAAPAADTRTAGDQPGGSGARDAWNTAAGDLRALAAELKPAPSPMRDPAADKHSPADKRSPVDAVDAALTGLGDRLRNPAVQASARRTATHVAAAVSASAHAVSHRSRPGPETADTPTDSRPDQKAANPDPDATQQAD
jgi:phage shock protein PspC (stress-responsive transcriptional regulator)